VQVVYIAFKNRKEKGILMYFSHPFVINRQITLGKYCRGKLCQFSRVNSANNNL